jgi:2-phosphoglycerate kinase
VTLVCGASGVGKSRIAVPLAARYGVALAEADDIVTALRVLTMPEQSPMLHFWNAHPEARAWSPERICELQFAVADELRPGLRAVIADHLECEAPVVFEGDYVVPDLAAGFGGAVRAVVISEPDTDRIVENFRAREPGDGEQRGRARVSALVEAELVKRAADIGMPVVSAWPWADGLDRVDRALRGWSARA